MIPFNKPYLSGKETQYIEEAVKSGKISGDGLFTKRCHTFFEHRYGFTKCLLTTSCTAALEMAAILLNIQSGDEVILPSYTFVSTANAFVLRGAKIIFADSNPLNPNLDAAQLESLITPRTKAIVAVHYAGIACDMEKIMQLAEKYRLFVVEDAAQAIHSYYLDKPLGSIGHLAAFSFHETKNIISGEGGMLVINDPGFIERAEIIREKGTNRSQFFRGEADKYSWVDIGSSFLPSEITAAFLFAQLENVERIQAKRRLLWDYYLERLAPLEKQGRLKLPYLPAYATNNAHIFYLLLADNRERQKVIDTLKAHDILAVFHYLSLHTSPYFQSKHDGRALVHADRYTDTLLRLPLYFELELSEAETICRLIEQVL
ncbi:MAG: dTDP-4-amino-4,6-dideoxygalactose transaminase [Spirosomataceae bacterium]